MAAHLFENYRQHLAVRQFAVRIWRSVLLLVAASLLFACGGSSGGSSETELTTACAAETVIWRVEGQSCVGNLEQSAPNKSAIASDNTLPATGTARYICNAGSWLLDESSVAATCTAPSEPNQPNEPNEPNQPNEPTGPNIQTVTLNLSAAANGRWYEYFSDVFSEIGHDWNGSQEKDGYFLIGSLPAYQPVGSGVDQFPHEGDWDAVGTISYNIAGYNGTGTFDAPITAVTADLNKFVMGETTILATGYETSVQPVSSEIALGFVQFNDGIVTGIELNSIIAFTWIAGNPLDSSDLVFSGPFTIARDNNFVLTAGEPSDATIAANDPTRAARWEFFGTVVDLVSEPLKVCAQSAVTWEVAGNSCSTTVAQAIAGATTEARDITAPATGEALFRCDSGTWTLDQASTAATCMPVLTGEQSMQLSLTANADGRWYEYFSDAFTEIGYVWNGSQQKDGFFRIDSLPNHVSIGSGVDQFPSEGNWADFGSLRYDVTGYTGVGAFAAPIRSITANLNPYVLGQQSVLGEPYTTSISQISGVVLLNNGVVTGIELTSTIAFMWPNGNPFDNSDLVFSGPFTITRDGRFVLTAGEPSDAVTAGNDFTKAARWDFSGTVTNLP